MPSSPAIHPSSELSIATAFAPQSTSQLITVQILGDTDVEPDETFEVTLSNPGKTIAFFVELRVVGDRSGRTILPVLWDDNYVSLLPGERKTLKARFAAVDLKGEQPVFHLAGWNVDAQ